MSDPITVALSYGIILADPALYAQYTAQYPNGVQMPPATAAVVFNCKYNGITSSTNDASAPIISGAAFDAATFLATGLNYGADVRVQSGSLAGTAWSGRPPTWPPQPAENYYWIGYFLYQPAAGVTTPPPPTQPVGVRRFLFGFEEPNSGEGFMSGLGQHSRAASRTVDGFGWAYRAKTINDGFNFAMPVSTNISWERFYVRPRKLPTGSNDMVWSSVGSADNTRALLHLDITPAGNLVFYNQGTQAFPGTLLLTSTQVLAVGTFYRIDVHFVIATNTPSTSGTVQIWLNGVSLGQFTITHGTTGLGTSQTHIQSGLGNTFGPATTNGLEADYDDWINSDFLDTTTGSHVSLVRPTGFGAAHNALAWTGDWRQLLPLSPENSASASGVTSSTALAQLDVTTDYLPSQLGVAAMIVGLFNVGANGAGTAQLGWILNGVQTVQNVSPSAAAWLRALYTLSGNTIPKINTLDLTFIKDNSGLGTHAISASSIFASVETIGVFGPEDNLSASVTIPVPSSVGYHNAPFPSIPQAQAGRAFGVPASVVIAQGIYTGNNLGQDIIQTLPASWWFVRALSGDTGGVWWWSTMLASHNREDGIPFSVRMPQALTDRMRAAGQDTQSNATAVSYQWIAVSDVGARYMLNGAFRHASTLASAINLLIDAGFTPEAAFFVLENEVTAGANIWYKGIGHAGAFASRVDQAQTNNVVSFGAGSITSQTPLHPASSTAAQAAFSAWQRTDRLGAGQRLFDLVTWTGDGTASRVMPCVIDSTIPTLVIVVPHNGISFFRDPSHVGTTSSQIDGTANAATGILAVAANSFTVGSALNGIGVVYDAFVLSGAGVVTPPLPPPPTPPPPTPTPIPVPPPVPTPIPTLGACYPLSQVLTDLGQRLGDPAFVHWTQAELTRYVGEALRVYNAMTLRYRTQGSFTATPTAAFYDLPTMLPTQRGYTVTDQYLMSDLEYSLMEPPTPTAWTGTAQFVYSDLVNALQRRRNQFLKESGMVLTREIAVVTPPVSGRISIPQDMLTIRRMCWVMNDTNYTKIPLHREDEYAMQAYARSWPTAVSPKQTWPTGYSENVTPPLTVQLGPPPVDQGWLDIIGVALGVNLNPSSGVGILMGVPDDWTWVVKFGALADLLSQEGLAYDPQRAAYCEARYQQGVELAKKSAVVLNAKIDGSPVRILSVTDADMYRRSWQSSNGTPQLVLLEGLNVLGLFSPADGNGPYTVTLDVVANMPVPVNAGDCINVGVDVADLDVLYDYVEHLALFKEGPGQLDASMDLYNRFARGCGIEKALDSGQFGYRRAVLEQSRADENVKPRMQPPQEPLP